MPSKYPMSQWFKTKWSYASLPSDEQDEKQLSQADLILHPKPWDRINLVFAIVTVVLSSLLIALVLLHRPPHQPIHESKYHHLQSPGEQETFLTKTPWNYSNPSPCGLSPDTARQAGCRWSAMTFAWYPADCYDEELDRDFFSLQDWAWYSTEDLKEDQKIPRDAILRGDVRKAYMSMEYHKIHCMYTVRKLYRALMGFALSDNYILTLGHLEHCERFVLRKDMPAVKGMLYRGAQYLSANHVQGSRSILTVLLSETVCNPWKLGSNDWQGFILGCFLGLWVSKPCGLSI